MEQMSLHLMEEVLVGLLVEKLMEQMSLHLLVDLLFENEGQVAQEASPKIEEEAPEDERKIQVTRLLGIRTRDFLFKFGGGQSRYFRRPRMWEYISKKQGWNGKLGTPYGTSRIDSRLNQESSGRKLFIFILRLSLPSF